MYYKQKYIESIETLKSNINGLSSEEAKKRLKWDSNKNALWELNYRLTNNL